MVTQSMVMGAVAPAQLNPDTCVLRQPALNQHATQSAETGTGLVRRDATMATPSLATGARQVVQSSAASTAPGAARPLRTRAHRLAVMASWRRMRSATTTTALMVMGAAPTARGKPGTTALRQPAIDPHAAQSAETGTGLVRRDATMVTPSLATGARHLAQSSAASSAPVAARPLRTRAIRPAVMASWRRMRSATTATPTMTMGAAARARGKPGTTAVRQPVIDPHAAQSAETGTGLVRRDATMATRGLAMGARQLAQSSAASIAWGEARPLRTRAHRPAATGRRRQMRSATTATPSMVMGAAALARKRTDGLPSCLTAAQASLQRFAETAEWLSPRRVMTVTPTMVMGVRQVARWSADSPAPPSRAFANRAAATSTFWSLTSPWIAAMRSCGARGRTELSNSSSTPASSA